MKVRPSKAALAELQAQHPGLREWQALEAPTRQETNDLKRRGFSFVVEKEGLSFYAKGETGG
jgi:hypothetical protein